MKIAMLKCIMKPKCGDIDEYLQWLNDHHLATESDAATQQRMIVDEAQNSIKSKAFRQERNESKADLKNEYIGLKEASNQSSELLKAKGVVRTGSDSGFELSSDCYCADNDVNIHLNKSIEDMTMSLSSAARMNSYTLATKRNNTSEKSVTSRKSLTNLSSLRSNTKKSTRGNLI
ncbi:unnamed protein product [Dracunculus medinensis]|uniref:Uncharacterized protein n=1 Tax=Dracunculus medinensis TaxID=318479 RepID=A0A158Q4I6_DRAME|nr:unnamed protein product [Dracunculus medinensis]